MHEEPYENTPRDVLRDRIELDQLRDRCAHALVFSEAATRALREALRLVDAALKSNGDREEDPADGEG